MKTHTEVKVELHATTSALDGRHSSHPFPKSHSLLYMTRSGLTNILRARVETVYKFRKNYHCWLRDNAGGRSFEEILSLARGNFEDQNKVLEPSIIIINYLIIINNTYYNYIVYSLRSTIIILHFQ